MPAIVVLYINCTIGSLLVSKVSLSVSMCATVTFGESCSGKLYIILMTAFDFHISSWKHYGKNGSSLRDQHLFNHSRYFLKSLEEEGKGRQ